VNILKELRVSFELRVIAMRSLLLSLGVIRVSWKKLIVVGVKQGWYLYLIFFGICINKLEACLEEASCA
jgi:hypothetical protein